MKILNFFQDVEMNRVREERNHDAKSRKNYLSKNMDIIHFLKYLHFQH